MVMSFQPWCNGHVQIVPTALQQYCEARNSTFPVDFWVPSSLHGHSRPGARFSYCVFDQVYG